MISPQAGLTAFANRQDTVSQGMSTPSIQRSVGHEYPGLNHLTGKQENTNSKPDIRFKTEAPKLGQ